MVGKIFQNIRYLMVGSTLRWSGELVLHFKSGWWGHTEGSGGNSYDDHKLDHEYDQVATMNEQGVENDDDDHDDNNDDDHENDEHGDHAHDDDHHVHDQVKFANISVGGRECRTVHDPVTGRSPSSSSSSSSSLQSLSFTIIIIVIIIVIITFSPQVPMSLWTAS